MRPALSVILLTTLIGAGQGLVLVLFVLELAASLHPVAGAQALAVAGSAVSVSLLLAGLGASFFHLGHPERAWRAAAKWRTSWLSREVIVLPALIVTAAGYGISHQLGSPATLWFGGIGAVLSIALFVCTGMIYACLKFLQEWHTPFTVVNFLLLGIASGTLLAAGLGARLAPEVMPGLAVAALMALIASAASRGATLARNRRLRARSSLQTAIGVKHPQIRQVAQGFSAGSFNTREFFHGRSNAVVRRIRLAAWGLAFVVPLLLVAAASVTHQVMFWDLAWAVQILGVGFERWTFFADARHPQNLYYQRAS